MANVAPDDRRVVARSVVGAFKSTWRDSLAKKAKGKLTDLAPQFCICEVRKDPPGAPRLTFP